MISTYLQLDKLLDKIPARLNVGLMLFTCCAVSYMLRVNMSVNLLAMVPPPPRDTNLTSECGEPPLNSSEASQQRDQIVSNSSEPRLAWGAGVQSLVLGAYYWGYLCTSLLGGAASERWGPRRVVAVSTLVAAAFTALSVPAAYLHHSALIVARLVIGLAGGVIYPALHTLVARWSPPAEKGRFVSALSGGTLGTVLTWAATGALIEALGWRWAFYLPAGIAALWVSLWLRLVADTPAQHPRISRQELHYIRDAIGDKITTRKRLPPLRRILTSLPFAAMVVLHYGNMWGLYFIMTVGPKFVSSVLGFELTAAGVVSALPHVARLAGSMLFGLVGDCIMRRGALSVTAVRKWFTVFSHVLPGALLVSLLYAGCDRALAVALISMSMGWNGAATLTNLQNHQDLAPNFAGTLYGIANFVGGTAGFITPMVTWYYTQNGNTFADWQPVFFIGAGVYILSALFFVLFGTGETQAWNDLDPLTDKSTPADHIDIAVIADNETKKK